MTLGVVERGSGSAPASLPLTYVVQPPLEKANGNGNGNGHKDDDSKSHEAKLQEALRDTRLKVLKVRRATACRSIIRFPERFH